MSTRKLSPEHIREYLSRDVHSILSVCRTEFKDDIFTEECFDVDAVMQGKGYVGRSRFEAKVAPAKWATASVSRGTDRPVTRPGRGSFIPNLRSAF